METKKVIDRLFANEAKEMKRICNKEMLKFGGISEMDYDDFYSRVGWDIALAEKSFDPAKNDNFKDYILGVIKLSVWKEMKHRNRSKRQVVVKRKITDVDGEVKEEKEYIPTASLDVPVGDEEGTTLIEMIASQSNVEKEVFGNNDTANKVERYLQSLPKITRKIVEMRMEDIEVQRIKYILGLTDQEYSSHISEAKMYEHIRLLHI